MKTLLFSISLFIIVLETKSQSCNPQGNQTSYGTNNVWRGYVYNSTNFTSYRGYVTEGSSSSPNFDEDFGGDNVNYPTNGCSVSTSTFSVRYKLTKTFSNGTYDFTVGGDDGYRLSLDGGNTWIINRWYDQSYTVSTYSTQLNGTYNLVLEFYENSGANRISFHVTTGCSGSDNTNEYGTANVWRAYMYDGINFDAYKGIISRGSINNPSFDESFGGSNTTFSTSCSNLTTETFSVRFRLTKTFSNGNYTFLIGGDDGYRFSLNGGTTWVVNRWYDQSYNVTSYSVNLSGTYDMVIEYYENGGDNRINFAITSATPLPIKLLSFTGKEENSKTLLNWKLASGSNPDYFEIERSVDGTNFTTINKLIVSSTLQADTEYGFTDDKTIVGKSYYRIKMTDLNGVVTYTKTITIDINKVTKGEILVFPSVIPSSGSLTIQTVKGLNNAEIVVTNSNGIMVNRKIAGKLQAGQTISFAPANSYLPSGMYFVQVIDNNIPVDTRKFIIK